MCFIHATCRSDVVLLKCTIALAQRLVFFILQLIMVDVRQSKIFVTRDEGISFVGRTLPFTPNRISFQSRSAPNVLEGTTPEHVIGYDQSRQEVCTE